MLARWTLSSAGRRGRILTNVRVMVANRGRIHNLRIPRKCRCDGPVRGSSDRSTALLSRIRSADDRTVHDVVEARVFLTGIRTTSTVLNALTAPDLHGRERA